MPSQTVRRIPGDPGAWILILGELVLFSAFFAVIATTRGANPEMFLQSQATLDHGIGLVNTLLLLTSSLAVALGWHRVRSGGAGAARLFAGALALGLGFVVLKGIEYGAKIQAGIGLLTNDFYMFYFVFTGIHLMHVVVGLSFLTLMTLAVRSGRATAYTVWIEWGALFWHLVDLLWIVLFTLFYLVK